MADNLLTTAQVLAALQLTEATIATDEIGGVHYQRLKLTFGLNGTATDCSASNPLPVQLVSSTVSPPTTDTPADEGSVVSVGTFVGTSVLAANPARVQATLIPEGDVYMSLGGTATNANGKLAAFTPYNLPAGYTGSVSMLSVSGTINVNVWDI